MNQTDTNHKPRRRAPSVDLSTMIYGKVPPQAKELEEAILGAIMLEKSAFEIVDEIIRPECFYVNAHQQIYKAFLALNKKNFPIDTLTVVEELKILEELDICGGPYYLTQLTNKVVSSANIETHARIVYQKFVQRELIRISGETLQAAYEDSTDAFDLVDELQKSVDILNAKETTDQVSDMATNSMQFFESIAKRMATPDSITGVTSGFPSIDHITWGWQPTDLIILAARPSIGKTALALNLARNARIPVAFFSLEMSKALLTERIYSAESEINMMHIKRSPTREQYNHLSSLMQKVEKMQIYIDDRANLTIVQLKRKAKKLVREKNVGLIIVDYLQLMKGVRDSHGGNREQEIADISRNLKVIAKELNIPVIALSQLSRDVEKRSLKTYEPFMSDLRESGAIEQDADVIAFLYKPDKDKDHRPGETNVKFAKHRNGILKTIQLVGRLHIQKFFEPDDPALQRIITPIDFTAPKANSSGGFDEGFEKTNEF